MDRRNRRHGSRVEKGVAALLRDERSLRIQMREHKNAQDAGSLSLSPISLNSCTNNSVNDLNNVLHNVKEVDRLRDPAL